MEVGMEVRMERVGRGGRQLRIQPATQYVLSRLDPDPDPDGGKGQGRGGKVGREVGVERVGRGGRELRIQPVTQCGLSRLEISVHLAPSRAAALT